MATPTDANYVNARAFLLDALDALGTLRRAVILVGAQAVYVHTYAGDADFAVSPYTFDADLALDPVLLSNQPKAMQADDAEITIDPASLDSQPTITEAMQAGGFTLTDQPGIYKRADGSQVDLLVPEAVGGPGNRGARLGIHGNRSARKVYGLEGALVSHKPQKIESLASDDPRSCVIEVAGPAALLVAKVHKLAERADDASRSLSLDKDAFDIFRLLRAVDTPDLASEVHLLLENDISGAVTAQAMSLFRDSFGDAMARGTRQVVQHVAGLEDSDFISESCVSLSQELLNLTS